MYKITLTAAELRALRFLVEEGAEGILTDASQVRAAGGKRFADAAERALEKIRLATSAIKEQS